MTAIYKSNGGAKGRGQGAGASGQRKNRVVITLAYETDWGRICYTLGVVLVGVCAEKYRRVYKMRVQGVRLRVQEQEDRR